MNKIKREDLWVYLGIFFFLVLIYFGHLLQWFPNPDAIWNGLYFKEGAGWETTNGRFLLEILQALKGNVVNGTFSTLVSFVLIVAICVLINKILNIEKWYYRVFVCLMLVLAPSVGCTLTYYYCSDMYFLAYFLCVAAVYCVVKYQKYGYLIASLLICISLSIYQAYISIYLVLCLLYVISKILKNKLDRNEYKLIFKMLVACVVGIVLYMLMNRVAMYFGNLNDADMRFHYLSAINFNELPKSILYTYETFFNYFFGNTLINNSACRRVETNILCAIVISIFIIANFVICYRRDKLNSLLFVLCLLLFPLCVAVMCMVAPSGLIENSTGCIMLAAMNYIAILFVLLFDNTIGLINKKQLLQLAIIGSLIPSLLFLYSQLLINVHGQTYYITKHNLVDSIANQLVIKLSEYDLNKPVIIWGHPENGNYPEQYQYLKDSVKWLTYSYGLQWDDVSANDACWTMYIKTKKGMYSLKRGLIKYPVERELLDSMKDFPYEGSIKETENYVIVKLSD